jgi:hypothetical protein
LGHFGRAFCSGHGLAIHSTFSGFGRLTTSFRQDWHIWIFLRGELPCHTTRPSGLVKLFSNTNSSLGWSPVTSAGLALGRGSVTIDETCSMCLEEPEQIDYLLLLLLCPSTCEILVRGYVWFV